MKTEDQETPQSPETPPAKGTGQAAREFARALRRDAAAAGRRVAGLLPASKSSPGTERDVGPARVRRRSWRVPGAFKLAVALVAAGTVAVAGTMLWAVTEVPLERAVAAESQPSIMIEAADGERLARRGPLKLADVEREEFPDHLVQAVIAIEDRAFYSHWGIDFRGAARAAYRNLAAQRVVEGGSTITQQLIKISMLSSERTMTRKLREMFLAVWLESQLDKDSILVRYLNNLYLGAGAIGMPAAARLYFSKEISELTLAESAMLAGLIRAPSHLNPLRNYEDARERADLVLDTMVESGAISPEEAEQAKAEPADINRMQTAADADTWFADWAADEALHLPGSLSGTIRVRTTLEPELQEIAEEVVAEMLNGAGAERGATQAALVAMRTDGAVLAMVGGGDYQESQFNRAVQSRRQPGSAFKVFVYYAALRNGLRPEDVVLDAPLELDELDDEDLDEEDLDDEDVWEPANFDREYYGEVSLREAFARSLNAATVRLALEVGLDEVIEAARDLGIDSRLGETPSLALGTYELSLLELTSAFAAIRAGETPVRPWGIAAVGTGEEGPLVAMGAPVSDRRSLGAAHEPILGMLQDVVERGTGRRAALDGFAAGKTGTSQNYRDAWFVGFTQDIVVGVWVGNDDNEPMDEVVGGQLPAETWREFVTRATPLLPDAGHPRLAPRTIDEELDELRMVAGFELPETFDDLEEFEDSVDGTRSEEFEGRRDRLIDRIRRAGNSEHPETRQGGCDAEACRRQYRSFRESDCTYQPYGGGPRRQCTRGDPTLATDVQDDDPVTTGSVPQGRSGQQQCNYDACARQYRSFRASDCTYQPYGGGPRSICTR